MSNRQQQDLNNTSSSSSRNNSASTSNINNNEFNSNQSPRLNSRSNSPNLNHYNQQQQQHQSPWNGNETNRGNNNNNQISSSGPSSEFRNRELRSNLNEEMSGDDRSNSRNNRLDRGIGGEASGSNSSTILSPIRTSNNNSNSNNNNNIYTQLPRSASPTNQSPRNSSQFQQLPLSSNTSPHLSQQQSQHYFSSPPTTNNSSNPSPSSPYPPSNQFNNRSPPSNSNNNSGSSGGGRGNGSNLPPPERGNSNSSTSSQQSHHHPDSNPPPANQPPPIDNQNSNHSHSHNHSSSNNNNNNNASGSGSNSRSMVPNNGSGNNNNSSNSSSAQACAKCEQPMTGQFVRALGTVYHLDCFRCQDCNKVVASKFFPVDDSNGRPYPLCETDYFRRLGLLCSKCGAALRGSYITALDMKFHVEHFTCSVCPTVFGPQDSYYEHAGSVYCHFHYSTRFAVKCTGCRTAILKQFVEINRNSTDEHWHPECYMIHKFWNIKLAPSPAVKVIESAPADLNASTSSAVSSLIPPIPDTTRPVESSRDATGPPSRALEEEEYLAQEASETPQSLKERQKLMEEQVYRIWTVLSAFEESSAACISEMLRFVSSGLYIEGVRMAEKFVLHVETLFSAIDDLSVQFKNAGAKEISHVREARMLCKKVVNFFSLLSHTHETGARKMSITQELLSLVTGLAHYLKILIRIALTAALKLEREHSNMTAIGHFLSRLDRLARDPEASQFAPTPTSANSNNNAVASSSKNTNSSLTTSKSPRAYGYKSLTRAVGTLVGQGEATTDLCESCRLTVEEECARFGTSIRWHLPCLRCYTCGKSASKENKNSLSESGDLQTGSVHLKDFWIEPVNKTSSPEGIDSSSGSSGSRFKGGKTYCKECSVEGSRDGFEYVTRLEQYAFLLCVALNKLYALLKQRGVVPSSPADEVDEASENRSLYDAYRDSTDIKRMKSVNLDRKLSSTTARIPKRSTVVQSPSGRTVQPTDSSIKPPIPSRKDQPLLDPTRASTVPRSPQINTNLPPGLSQSQPNSSTGERYRPEDLRRPSFARATTAIKIIEDQVLDNQEAPFSRDESPNRGPHNQPLGTLDEDGITLADLPTMMEAEQAREQRRYQPARSGMLLSELSALEYFIVKHVAALMLTSDNSAFKDVAPLDDLLEMIDARKNTFWGKLFKGGNEKKNIKKKGVFGISLDVLVERNGADSMHGAGPGSLRVPSFVDDVISAMKQMDMSVEGVFRKNGNIRRLKDLSEALDRDPGSVNLSDENPVQLAALLKRFLRDLPDPLLTFKLFQLFIATQRVENLEERKKIMHLVCCLMPKYHRDTMEVVFVFLKWVASFSHVDEETGSKMDLQNLATVICPNILYSKGKDPYKDESFSAIRTLHELLEYQDDFWTVPEEFASILNDQELFNNPSQLTSKEILARAENHVRSSQGRRNGSGGSGGGTTTRGEIHPQRPDLQQAFSAPNVGSRGATGNNAQRYPSERPISFSTYTPNAANLPPSMVRPNQLQQQQQYLQQQQQQQQFSRQPPQLSNLHIGQQQSQQQGPYSSQPNSPSDTGPPSFRRMTESSAPLPR